MYNRYLQNPDYEEESLQPNEVEPEVRPASGRGLFGLNSKGGLAALFSGLDLKLSLDIIDLLILGVFFLLYIETGDDELLIAMAILVVMNLFQGWF